MNSLFRWLVGTGVTAAATYYWDPDLGRRRRALLRDQWVHTIAKVVKAADTTARDLRNRTYGTYAELRRCILGDRGASDEVIVDRVRARLGRYVSHPAAIEVCADDGTVTLRGPILAHEVDDFIAAVKSTPGVVEVLDELEIHETADDIAALQGGSRRTGETIQWRQENWAPAPRLLAGATGAALMLNCAVRRNGLSPLFGAIGFGLLVRSITNMPLTRLLGMSPGRQGLEFHKTITIDRPVREVFALLAEPTRYPEFSDVIAEVRELGGHRYLKTICAPRGMRWTVTEKITTYFPDRFVACSSEPDSPIQFAGRAHFVPLDNSRTKVEIEATYNPPGGVLSHAVAAVARMDLKSQLDKLLIRAKTYLETGKPPHSAAGGPEHNARVNPSTPTETQFSPVDEASEASFPASDPPSYSGSAATRSYAPVRPEPGKPSIAPGGPLRS